jgi:hypothetical protein
MDLFVLVVTSILSLVLGYAIGFSRATKLWQSATTQGIARSIRGPEKKAVDRFVGESERTHARRVQPWGK